MKLPDGAYSELLRGLLAEGQPVLTTVRGGSMWPFIEDGAVVRLLPAGAIAPRVGVVVLRCRAGGRLLCHRLSRRRGNAIQTWGDACAEPDGWGEAGEIIAVVDAIRDGDDWRPVAVRCPLRMAWRYLKRRLRGGGGRVPPPSCEPYSANS